MFGKIKKISKNLSSLNYNKIMISILNESSVQYLIIDLNQLQMDEYGVDSMGDSLGEYRSATIYGTKNFEGKISKGQRYDHITLNDTGTFYNSMRVVVGTDSFIVTGNMDKFGVNLQDRWPDALGLTEESKKEVSEILKEHILKIVKSQILK